MYNNLRKCIVEIPSIENRYMRKGKEVGTEVVREAEDHNALFHQWIKEEYTVAPSPFVGGDNGGQYSHTYALVEYENGTIHKVEPEYIRFIDNIMDGD